MLKRYDPSTVRRMYVEEGVPFAECCRKVGWNRKQAERVRKILQPERQAFLQRRAAAQVESYDPPAPSIEESGDTRSMTGFTEHRIETLEQLLAHFKVDTATWEVERWKCGQWQMGYKDRNTQQPGSKSLYKIEATFRRRKLMTAVLAEIEDMKADAAQWAPRYPFIVRPAWARAENLAEISIYDAHLGKLCWGQETGTDYDLKIAKDLFIEAAQTLISRATAWNPDRFLLVVGNDFLNADNSSNMTTRGTPQAMDGRYHKVFKVGRRALIEVIDIMLGIAPVDVVMIPGNHDWESTYAIGDSLECWYRNCPDAHIDDSPTHRKYVEWGKCMLGLVHGDKQKADTLPLQMAADRPDMWGRTLYREFHTGHWHARRGWEWQGVSVKALPSLCGTDAWHNESGFTHNMRSAVAMIWNREDGLVGDSYYTIKPGRLQNELAR